MKQIGKNSVLQFFVRASLASQILIVVTGGAVRLTGSGLGCPTWPKCTADSLVTVPEQGIHGFIEFANRLLTFVLLIVALATVVLVWRSRKTNNRKLLAPSVLLVLGIPAQAILGGFTVLYNLNPWLVGGHFIISAVMIGIAALLVWRWHQPQLPQAKGAIAALNWPIALFGALSVVIGVLVTGAGPHSGDTESPRNGLDLELWQHIHSYPAYVLLALVLWQLLLLRLRTKSVDAEFRQWPFADRISLALLLALVAQAIIGVAQARLGVPPLLVGLHMLGASVICALLVFNFCANRSRYSVRG